MDFYIETIIIILSPSSSLLSSSSSWLHFQMVVEIIQGTTCLPEQKHMLSVIMLTINSKLQNRILIYLNFTDYSLLDIGMPEGKLHCGKLPCACLLNANLASFNGKLQTFRSKQSTSFPLCSIHQSAPHWLLCIHFNKQLLFLDEWN